MQKSNQNRTRKISLTFRVSDKEYEQIKNRMNQVKIRSIRAYLLKMALNGHVYHIELESVKEMVRLLSSATNNINQIAKKANETDIVLTEDIAYLTRKIDDIWTQSKKVLQLLSELVA